MVRNLAQDAEAHITRQHPHLSATVIVSLSSDWGVRVSGDIDGTGRIMTEALWTVPMVQHLFPDWTPRT
jgi:hypothetical protein